MSATGGELSEDRRHRDAQTADARGAAHLVRVDRDALELHRVDLGVAVQQSVRPRALDASELIDALSSV